MAWLLIAPIYLAARTAQWLTQRAEAAAIREAAWVNAVAPDLSVVRENIDGLDAC